MNPRDQILNGNDFSIRPIETPEWSVGRVHIRTIPHTERRRVFKSLEADPDLYIARLAVAVICDEKGVRIFRDEDAPALATRSSAVLDRITNAWMELTTLKPEEVQALEKNS